MGDIWYYLVIDGVVVQKQPYEQEGFVEGPSWIAPGFLYENGEFKEPPPPPVDWPNVSAAELNRRGKEARRQLIAIGLRSEVLDWIINIQDRDAMGDEFVEPLPEDSAEIESLKAVREVWLSYSARLGRLPVEQNWPVEPLWPDVPELYVTEPL